ncbi:MAG: hypothetical protein H0Z33_09630 [Bacillaceae bacterium]|nr:hypothetical protein [Bacillaceae bacterium]
MSNRTALEPIKTILLILLIAVSLILSWMLWNSEPDYEYIHPSQYVEPQPFGEEKKVEEILQPAGIVFHYGNQLHTRALPGVVHFGYVKTESEKWYFYDLKPARLTGEEWNRLLNETKGIEIIFPDEIPVTVLQQYYELQGRIENQMETVNKIWIYENEAEALAEVLLISDENEKLLRGLTAITLSELENLLSLGNVLPTQIPLQQEDPLPDQREQTFLRVVYVPEHRVEMRQFRYFYQPITEEQMVRLLFVDPTATRQITERDGTIIYTDGSRGVQVPPNRRTMMYHEPRMDATDLYDINVATQLNAVVDFVNRNGGWTGQYLLEGIDLSETDEDTATYHFRQYEGSYPIFGTPLREYGKMELTTQGTFITEFQRPLFQIDRFMNYETKTLWSGPEIMDMLPVKGIDFNQVRNMYPGYRMEIGHDYLDLIPVWVIDTEDTGKVFIEETVPPQLPERATDSSSQTEKEGE